MLLGGEDGEQWEIALLTLQFFVCIVLILAIIFIMGN